MMIEEIDVEIMKETHFQKCVPSFSSFWGAEGRILVLHETKWKDMRFFFKAETPVFPL